ncbi:glycoside hydrolase family 10 protein [Chitinimonas sp. BJYL2]|uniref:glycoside hydrolase family 10 protein n=1 Tax=Chitinimonas sp. BJYL2 TaxID=2976696 RepID=UPI0022B59F0C|nr:family 10 glycosylhydrolase [Chitinimonas sp. BJYL2]
MPAHPLCQGLPRRLLLAASAIALALSSACAQLPTSPAAKPQAMTEVRGTWVTTTANQAITTPADTARTMRRLREIGINTVYVENWKNGYTQFPSKVLERTIGVDRRPALAQQDPSDKPSSSAGRDLVEETLIELHRNGLISIGWFEYGFMAAHQGTMNHLRKQKPDWLSRDIKGNEVAPNGFVWMNPLHPEARRFLLDLVLEAVDRYDLDGVQLDDRIVWPYITMGYDDYTRAAYAREHNGQQPPADHKDPEWMRWRAAKVNEYGKWFVQEVRAKKPGLVISLSPGVYPWSWDNYLLDWPAWSAWQQADRLTDAPFKVAGAQDQNPRWDEYIPQAYRFSYAAFETTWKEQIAGLKAAGNYQPKSLLAGIRIVGDGADSSWQQLKDSIELTRREGNGGHVLWFSRGVLDLYPKELTEYYRASGPAISPWFPAGWRQPSIALERQPGNDTNAAAWQNTGAIAAGDYRLIGFDGQRWHYLDEQRLATPVAGSDKVRFIAPARFERVELLLDRRAAMRAMPARQR